eukprot:924368-Pyramimonas_sp.AAC.1
MERPRASQLKSGSSGASTLSAKLWPGTRGRALWPSPSPSSRRLRRRCWTRKQRWRHRSRGRGSGRRRCPVPGGDCL